MRIVLLVQLGWSRLLRASLAQLGVLVAHLDQSGVHGAWSTIARGGRVCCHLLAYERRVTRAASDVVQMSSPRYDDKLDVAACNNCYQGEENRALVVEY